MHRMPIDTSDPARRVTPGGQRLPGRASVRARADDLHGCRRARAGRILAAGSAAAAFLCAGGVRLAVVPGPPCRLAQRASGALLPSVRQVRPAAIVTAGPAFPALW